LGHTGLSPVRQGGIMPLGCLFEGLPNLASIRVLAPKPYFKLNNPVRPAEAAATGLVAAALVMEPR